MKYKGGFLYKKEEELTRTDIVARWILQNTGLLEKHERLYEVIEKAYQDYNEIEMTDEEIEEWESWDYRLRYYRFSGTFDLDDGEMIVELLDKTDEENYLRFMEKEWSGAEREWHNYLSRKGRFQFSVIRGTLGIQRWNLVLKIRKNVNSNEHCWIQILATKWIDYIDFEAYTGDLSSAEEQVSIEEIDNEAMKKIERSLILFSMKGD